MLSPNYDQEEIKKFSSISSHWWDTEGQFKTLHQINPLRLCYIKEKITLSNALVLDVGCGGGILAESMAKEGAKVTGIDLSHASLEVAKLHQLESKTSIEYLALSAEELALTRAGHYDVISCLEMLEHVPNPEAIIKACAILIKPGGHLFFSTLNRNLKSYLFAVLGAEYILKLLPRNTHDYKKFIRPSELCAWLNGALLTPKEMKGISYHPLKKQFSLSNDISINYLLHAVKR